MSVEAAGKIVKLAGKSGKVVKVDKRGNLSVAVRNAPSVKVPGGVAVTNQPSVKVPEGVAVTNQPAVKVPDGVAVNNHPTDIAVHAEPDRLNATTRPSTRDVVNMEASRLSVGWMKLLEVPAGKRGAVTELTLTAQGPDGPQVYRLEAWIRKGATGSCDQPNLSDFTKQVLRQVSVRNYETVQLTFADAPLPVPPPTAGGGLVCFGVVTIQAPNGSESHVGGTAFTY